MKVTIAADVGSDVALIKQALEYSGHEVDIRIVDKNFAYNIKGAIVFNASTSFPGRYGNSFIPAVLEGSGIPYTGPDALTSAICQDHASMRSLLRQGGIHLPRWAFIETLENLEILRDLRFSFPIVYKSNYSRKGEKVVYYSSKSDFFSDVEEYTYEMFWPAIVDEYLPGREIVVFCYGNGKDFKSLKPIQIEYTGEILDDDARENCSFKLPKLLDSERSSIYNTAYKAHHLMGINGLSRIDFKLGTDHLPIVLEIDPNPELDNRAIAAIKASNLNTSDILNYILNIAIYKIHGDSEDSKQHELFQT